MDSTLYPPDTDSPQESSEDNLDNDSLDEFGPVAADSGVSEVGSQRPASETGTAWAV